MIKSPWIFYNLSQYEWGRLPWEQKKNMLHALCPELKPDPTTPEPTTFSNLFNAYLKHSAETFTIQENYPQTKEYLK